MEVSMDGLRKNLLSSFNSLAEKLNSKIDDNNEICVDAYYIQKEMDNIRSCIVTLAFTYQEGEGGWNSFDESTHFESFNYQE